MARTAMAAETSTTTLEIMVQVLDSDNLYSVNATLQDEGEFADPRFE